MYELNVGEKKFKIIDYYELNGAIEEKTVDKEDFYKKLAKKIERTYDLIIDFGKETNEENIKSRIIESSIKGQLIIDYCYEFLIKSEEDFEKYYKKIAIKDEIVSEIKKGIIEGNVYEDGVCFNSFEIEKNIKNYNRLDSFYYMAFTLFFLEEFLLAQFTLFSNIYIKSSLKKKEVLELHKYFVKIFTLDFSNAFKIFEESLI